MDLRRSLLSLSVVATLAAGTFSPVAALAQPGGTRGAWDFEPLTASAVCTAGGDPTQPLQLPEGYTQTIIASEPDFQNLPDMNTLNETGPHAGRYLYRAHEVGSNGAVSVTDLETGITSVVAQRAHWERLDGIVWTPWGTLVTAEETNGAGLPDPDHPAAIKGLAYEINPETGDARVLPAVGARSHEGLAFDAQGNLYGISERNPGYIYKFTPDRPGDLSSGQLYALQITEDAGDRTGEAVWVALDRAQVQIDSDAAAAAMSATGYSRPEDIEIVGQMMYVAITGENRVLAVELRQPAGDKAHGTAHVSSYVEAGVNAPADFAAPDNLVADRSGNLYISEDPGGNTASGKRGDDIWVAAANPGNGRAAAGTVRFATVTDCEAEPTGIYFDKSGNTLYVNIQHRGGDGRDLAVAVRKAALYISRGVASGDVSQTSAVVWGRANSEATMHVEFDVSPAFTSPASGPTAPATAAGDLTAQVKLTGLTPNTVYYYRVWFTAGDLTSDRQQGTFRTAPAADSAATVSFIWGGDVAGQQYCRRVDQGYAIFQKMQALNPSFFVANGDMIYADGNCPADGPGNWVNIPGDFASIPNVDWTDMAAVRENYLDHWRYNRLDPYFQQFLRSTSMYSQWDDHEVINDFGGLWPYWNLDNMARPGYPNLVEAGREAMFLYSPIDRHPAEPNRIYRSFNWGRDLDLFIIDARSYRSQNHLADTEANAKTMLGAAQLEWLKQGLLNSTATWKVISSDIPLSITTGSNAASLGRDAWANGTLPTGFERELTDLLRFLDEHDVKNVVFVTTDVHFTQTLRYETNLDGDGDTLLFHELVTGPINAVRGGPGTPDPTFNPTVLYQEGGIFNFGYARIERGEDGKAHLKSDVRGTAWNAADTIVRPGSAIDLVPQE